MKLVRRLISWGNAYFNRTWVFLPAQPLLYAFVLATTWNVGTRFILDNATSPHSPIGGWFPHHLGDHDFQAWYEIETEHGTVWIWCLLGMLMPLLWFTAMGVLLRPRCGRWVWRGLWWRTAADAGMFAFFLMFAIPSASWHDWHVDALHVGLTWFATVFVGLELIRDVWSLKALRKEIDE